MSESEENKSACEAKEFAELLFQKFVLDREPKFLGTAIEGLQESALGVFRKRRFSLLVACGILGFGFNGSAQNKVGVSVSHFKKAAQNHAETIWPGENFESNLALGMETYYDCIRQAREKGKPSLTWVRACHALWLKERSVHCKYTPALRLGWHTKPEEPKPIIRAM